jgi:hypothetical protein
MAHNQIALNPMRQKISFSRLSTALAVVGMSLLIFGTGIQASAKDLSKAKHSHHKMTKLTEAERISMAEALEKKATCLRGTEDISKCHEEMKASCNGGEGCAAHHADGSGTCPMMEQPSKAKTE